MAVVVLAPFAAGFFLSYFFRSLNAVLSPHLEQDLGLGPEALGWLTSAYFLGFALFQLPLGLLLDRYGPARTQACLMALAAAGMLLFALCESFALLILARGLIGVGVSGSLMSAFMTIAQLFEQRRRPLVNGCFLVFGGLGAIMATGPLDYLLTRIEWPTLFLLGSLAGAGLAVLFWSRRGLHDRIHSPASGSVEGWGRQLRALGEVARDRGFWRIAPLSALSLGTIWSFQGLWSALWLRDVVGFSVPETVGTLSAMATCTLVGNLFGGFLTDRLGRHGIRVEAVMIGGCSLLLLVELSLVLAPTLAPSLLWCCFALLTGFATLAYVILPHRYPPALTGRVLTAVNVLSLFSAFVIQAMIGVVVEQWAPDSQGRFPATAYHAALGLILTLQAAFLVNCVLRKRAP